MLPQYIFVLINQIIFYCIAILGKTSSTASTQPVLPAPEMNGCVSNPIQYNFISLPTLGFLITAGHRGSAHSVLLTKDKV